MTDRVRVRGGTVAERTAAMPVLAARELACTTDDGMLYLGDGLTAGGKAVGSDTYVQLTEHPPTPQQYWQAGDADWTAAFGRLFASGATAAYVPPSATPYDISAGLWQPVTMKHLTLDPGATVRATAALTDPMLTLGVPSVLVQFASVTGGTWDCNYLANDGIHVPYSWGTTVADLAIRNHQRWGLTLGDPTAPQNSAQHKVNNVEVIRDAGALPSGSRGIWIAKASDGSISNTTVQSAETSFYTDSPGNRFYSCHGWNASNVGLHTTTFYDNGGNNDYIACNSDSAAAYGWHLKQWWIRIIGGFSIFFNATYDNVPIGVHVDCGGPEFRGLIADHRWSGDPLGRWYTDYDGTVPTPQFHSYGCSGWNVTNPVLSRKGHFGQPMVVDSSGDTTSTGLLVRNDVGTSADLLAVQAGVNTKFRVDQYGVAYQLASFNLDGVRMGNGSAYGAVVRSGTGNPNGTVSATAGDGWIRTDGGAGTWLYRCTGGVAWTAVI